MHQGTSGNYRHIDLKLVFEFEINFHGKTMHGFSIIGQLYKLLKKVIKNWQLEINFHGKTMSIFFLLANIGQLYILFQKN